MRNSTIFLLLLSLILLIRIAFTFTYPQKKVVPIIGEVIISGILTSEPKVISKAQIFTVDNIAIVASRYPELSYGDAVEITGKTVLSEDKPKMLFPKVKLIENPNTFIPLKPIFDFKRKLIAVFHQILPEPEAGLVTGILLGAKSELDPSLKLLVQNTGLTHVVVASGANLTFVSGLVFAAALLIVGRRWGNMVAIPVIWLYAVIAGFEPAVVRAAAMISFCYIANFLGRPTGAWRGLVMAIYIMILFDPNILMNLGFQLSVAAMTGVIIFGGGLVKQTLGPQLMTLPLIVGVFGRYGLLSLLANIVVLWTVPPIMAIGALSGLVGLVSIPLARLFIIPAEILLSYFVAVVTFFGKFDTLVLTLPKLDATVITGIYLVIIAGIIYVHQYDTRRA